MSVEKGICFVHPDAADLVGTIVFYYAQKGWQVYVSKWNQSADSKIYIYGYPPKSEEEV